MPGVVELGDDVGGEGRISASSGSIMYHTTELTGGETNMSYPPRLVVSLLAVSLCGLAAIARAQGSVESDRAALLALYNATDGPN